MISSGTPTSLTHASLPSVSFGLLYRTFHQADQCTLTQLYKSLVIPKMDYCSCVWDPHTATLINSLESVQSFAAKLCTKSWTTPSCELIASLNWSSLRSRRLRQKAQLCHRIIKKGSIIPPMPYFHPLVHPNPRIHHSQPVTTPFARTSSFQNSFFISSCSLWNSLPDSAISLSARAFKSTLALLPAFNF